MPTRRAPCSQSSAGGGWQALAVACAAAGGAAAVSAAVLFARRERAARAEAELDATACKAAAERSARLREEERKGRVRAELQLRERQASGQGAPGGEGEGEGDGEEDRSYTFHPIGTFDSCYRARCGTPRQGGVVAESLAVLRCSRDLNPAAALEGFAEYSHCWVLYVFHQNTNMQREGRTAARRGRQTGGRVPLWQGLCMKVAPPRCPDADLRVGVLACRTPHRPNPVGLSLARIVSVNAKAGEVTLAGLDVVDGTPCLDLKPYLPGFESLPDARVPRWVQDSFEEPLMSVAWSTGADADLSALLASGAAKASPFADETALRRALEGTLALDIRSPVQRGRHPNPATAPPPGAGAAAAAPADLAPFFSGDLWFHQFHVTYSLLAAPGPCVGPLATVRIDGVRAETPTGAQARSGNTAAVQA